MQNIHSNTERAGIASAAGAYLIWGFLPIYWKLLVVPADEILAHRIMWSFFFMVFIIMATKKADAFRKEWSFVVNNQKRCIGMILASLLISVNWLTYIWAVNDNRIVETSFGYYINPLVSVMLGIIVLKERLSFWQTVSFIIAALGVLNMSLQLGSFPWVAIVLAITFGLYGLCKKMVGVGAITSITIETLIVAPVSLIYLAYLGQQGTGVFVPGNWVVSGLLVGSGVVTAVPLLLFASGANRLPLAVMGFLQYLAPTIALVVGVVMYNEPFTHTHLVSFSCIWAALAIFSLSKTRPFIKLEAVFIQRFLKKQQLPSK